MWKKYKAYKAMRLRKKVMLALLKNQQYNAVFDAIGDCKYIIYYVLNGFIPKPPERL
jgi:hypothetical protein